MIDAVPHLISIISTYLTLSCAEWGPPLTPLEGHHPLGLSTVASA